MSKVSNFIDFTNQKLKNLDYNKKVIFYILIFLLFLSFFTLVPFMVLKRPCISTDNDEDVNCSSMYEFNKLGLMHLSQTNYLALYIMSLLFCCICFILTIVLLVYILK